MKLVKMTLGAALMLSMFFFTSCAKENGLTDPVVSAEEEIVDFRGRPTAGPTIADIAGGNSDFSILVAALRKTGLVGLLDGPQSFTVVAPTNQAFIDLLNAVPAWSSLDDIPEDVLEDVLKYHISPRPNGSSGKLAKGTSIPTLLRSKKWFARPSGGTLEIVGNNSSALVTAADIKASNGYVHVIDAVILP